MALVMRLLVQCSVKAVSSQRVKPQQQQQRMRRHVMPKGWLG
jgi:hypothetical protein